MSRNIRLGLERSCNPNIGRILWPIIWISWICVPSFYALAPRRGAPFVLALLFVAFVLVLLVLLPHAFLVLPS